MSVANPPSHCPQCGYIIPWYQNIPLVTRLWQRGRCAGCDVSIPVRYVLVELLTGLAFLGAWLLCIIISRLVQKIHFLSNPS